MKNKLIISIFITLTIINLNLVFPQLINNQNYNYGSNAYSPYNQNPNYYNQYNNQNSYDPRFGYNQGYNNNLNRFNNNFYPNQQIRQPFLNNQPNLNSGSYYSSNSYIPSRNIQLVNPNFQSNTYGGFGSYNNLGRYGYSQGQGAYGLSGLYGYGQYNNQFGFSPEMCQNNQDFLVHVAPGGCTPAIVRSDLLEEQNVPVFCRLQSFQVNPLLSGTRIRSLRIKGEFPKGISGVSYYPGRAAINNAGIFNRGFLGGLNYNQYNTGFNSFGYNRLGLGSNQYNTGYNNNYLGLFNTNPLYNQNFQTAPVNDNMGYLVIVLSPYADETTIPDFVEGEITAVIDYDSTGGFGIGRSHFYLNEMNEEEWQSEYRENSFWQGKGYIRAESIEPGQAIISVYRDVDQRDATVTLREGEISQDVYLGGFYCSAGMRLRLERIAAPVESALLQINDEQIWVSKGDRFINNRCRVSNLIIDGSRGKIDLNCPGSNFNLDLKGGKATFEINGNRRDITINQLVNENIYLGYIGKDTSGQDIAILVKDPISNSETSFADKNIFTTAENAIQNQRDLKEEIKKQYQETGIKTEQLEIIILGSDQQYGNIKLIDVFSIKNEEITNNPIATTYYDKAISNYQDLADFYPNEKESEGEQAYAAKGLDEAYKLSIDFEKNERANQLSSQLIENYQGSYLAEITKTKQNDLFKYDRTNAKKFINVDGLQYSIDLLELKKPPRSEASGIFIIDGQEIILGLGDFHNAETANIQLLNLDDDRSTIGYEYNDNNGNKISRSETLIFGEKSQTNINGVNIKLNAVNLKKQARISILPNLYGTRTEASFDVKIGIEKRGIKLSPDRTKEVVDNLKEVIEDWNKVNEKLGNVISTLKAACFGTSAVLTVKNFFEGTTGASLARNRIMTTSGGWNERCEELVNRGDYTSVQQCLLDKNSEIQNDVKIFSDELKNTNNIMKKIKDDVGIERTDILDLQGQTDAQEVERLFKEEQFKPFCENINDKVKLPGANNQEIQFSDICDWDAMSHEQRREIMTLYSLKNKGGSDILDKYIDKEIGRLTLDGKNLQELTDARISAQENTETYDLGVPITNPIGDTITYGSIKTISGSESNHNIYRNFEKGDSVIRIYIPHNKQIKDSEPFTAAGNVGGKEVIVKLNQAPGSAGIFNPDTNQNTNISTIDGRLLTTDEKSSVYNYMSLSGLNNIKEGNLKAYQNQMVDIENLRVKYFDRQPFRGLPSLIPIDIDEGWYVKMSYVLSGFGTPYDESGRVVNYYICNVGPNGIVEFKQSSDDICRYYNGFNRDLSFPGMNSGESIRLIQKAQQAINQASRQYGDDRVTINGKSFQTGVSFDNTDGQCTDFMSPQDCNIMFNVCDPVICPSSRCDLGGKYRVDNVIQTGVIGSLALCLPNIQEGIAIPICLTGVHAGLDGYVSILNSTVSCLEESIETGRNIGICDEIKSVYMCDFFWRQATPFLDVLLERSFEVILGQGTRGGGEYLTVRNAWDNTRRSVDFFTQNYAVNSVRAFFSRNINDVRPTTSYGSGAYGGVGFNNGNVGYAGGYGGIGEGSRIQGQTYGGFAGNVGAEICKSFISTGFSGSASSIFDALIEPDSPEQYHAWFSENTLTTATVPPTSHYKVYFNIYAGKDIGAYFSVYLKDAPQTPGVFSSGFLVIDQGYVARGSQIDKARDLTATSGFRQLCININGREECGFGQVSTSYALNSLADAYVQQQSTTNIISERECIAGRPSLYSFAQPNIQAGVEEVLNPQLYNQGIIRICSTENPGKQVLPTGDYDRTNSNYDRWKDIGYCDDPTIRCWLDTGSVKDVVRDKGIEQQILEQTNLASLGVDNFYIPENSEAILTQSKQFIDKIPQIIARTDSQSIIDNKINEVVSQLELLSNLGSNNLYRAKGLYFLANLHRTIARVLITPPPAVVPIPQIEPSSETQPALPPAIPPTPEINNNVPGGELPIPVSDFELIDGAVIRIEDSIYSTALSYRYTFEDGWFTSDDEIREELILYNYIDGVGYIVDTRIGVESKVSINSQLVNPDYDSILKELLNTA